MKIYNFVFCLFTYFVLIKANINKYVIKIVKNNLFKTHYNKLTILYYKS